MSSGRPSVLARGRWSAHLAVQAVLQRRFQYRPLEVIERAQGRRVQAVVAYAHGQVPYYRETINRLGLSADDFRTASDLAKLPLLEREQLQRDPEYFVSRAVPLSGYMRLHTGGTTGQPISVFQDAASVIEGQVVAMRSRPDSRRLMPTSTRRIASLSLPGGPGSQRNAAIGHLTLTREIRTKRRAFSMLDPLPKTLPELNAFRPHMIMGFGSVLERLFAHVATAGHPFHRPRVVLYGGDRMSSAVRRLISERFGAEVFSTYRAVEGQEIGFECAHHLGYHLNSDVCPVRIVDKDGSEAVAGEPGDVVISNLLMRGTVLLNYRLGDRAALVGEPCPCGRGLPLLSLIEGRTSDWIRRPDGELVHAETLLSPLDDEPEVLRYQVIQEKASTFVVSLVTRPGCDRGALRRRLARTFSGCLGAPVETRVDFDIEPQRTATGKVRVLVPLEDSSRGARPVPVTRMRRA